MNLYYKERIVNELDICLKAYYEGGVLGEEGSIETKAGRGANLYLSLDFILLVSGSTEGYCSIGELLWSGEGDSTSAAPANG